MTDNNNNSWTQWSKYVLHELERLDKNVELLKENLQLGISKAKDDLYSELSKLQDKIHNIELNFTGFKEKMEVRSSIFGIVGAGIAILIAIAIKVVFKISIF